MSSRPLIKQYPIVVNGSLAADLISPATIILMVPLISYELSWSGPNPVGAFNIEVSDSYSINPDGSVNNAGVWNVLPISPAVSATGVAGNAFINLAAVSGYALRLHYVRTSGSGTLQAFVNAKVS